MVLALEVGEALSRGKTERDRFVGVLFDWAFTGGFDMDVPRSKEAGATATGSLGLPLVVGLGLFVGEEGSLPMVVAT